MGAWRGLSYCLLGAVVALLLGCSARPAAVPRRDFDASINVGGVDRTYHVHVPPAHEQGETVPLLLALHGREGTGPQLARFTRLNDLADTAGFAVTYPDGPDRSWADGRGTTPAALAGTDDVAFLMAMVDRLERDLRLDPGRLYVAGISNGGFMTQRLACQHADRFAAVVSIAASGSTRELADCQPARPIPIALILGTADPLVPWQGGELRIGAGGSVLSGPATFARWAEIDGCTGDPAVTEEPDRAGDGTRVSRQDLTACAGDAEVRLYQIEGGGHAWPGAAQYLPAAVIGRATRNLDANVALWEFVSRHRVAAGG